MGEAKRRKLLGLMPAETRFPFSVERGLGPVWTEQLPPAELVAEVTRTIGEILGNTPGSWDSQSRTLALQHAEREYRSRAEIDAIAVPGLVRGVAVLVSNMKPDPARETVEKTLKYRRLSAGQHLYLDALESSTDAHTWTPRLPRLPRSQTRPHRGLDEPLPEGPTLGFTVWRDGRAELTGTEATTLDDLAPEAVEALQKEMTGWYGATPEEWDEVYREHLDYFGPPELTEEEVEAAVAPLARRGTLSLLADHHVLPPLSFIAFGVPGYHVGVNYGDETVSFDGETWVRMPSDEEGQEQGQRLSVTAWQDGRVEWDDADLQFTDEQARNLRALVRQYVGDTPEQWDDEGRRLLLDYHGGELTGEMDPDGEIADERLPVPVAVRLLMPTEQLAALLNAPEGESPEELSERLDNLDTQFSTSFEEDAYSLDGLRWHLVEDDAPEDLLSFVRIH